MDFTTLSIKLGHLEFGDLFNHNSWNLKLNLIFHLQLNFQSDLINWKKPYDLVKKRCVNFFLSEIFIIIIKFFKQRIMLICYVNNLLVEVQNDYWSIKVIFYVTQLDHCLFFLPPKPLSFLSKKSFFITLYFMFEKKQLYLKMAKSLKTQMFISSAFSNLGNLF